MGFFKKLFGKDKSPEKAPTKKPVAPQTKPVETKELPKETLKESKPKPRKYHVSYNKDSESEHYKMWRVRKEHSEKTIQYFKTQKEAIEYAETLAEHAGSSVVIHKMDGSIRKQNYR